MNESFELWPSLNAFQCGVIEWMNELTLHQLKDSLALLLNLQVKVGAVAQHNPLCLGLLQEPENSERQIQNQTHCGLDSAGSEVHGQRVDNKYLQGKKYGGKLLHSTN